MSNDNAQQQQNTDSSKLRNRLVGTIILVAAAVIIIPSILDGRKTSYKDEFKQVPDKGDFKPVQNSKTFPANEFEQHQPKDETPVTDEVPQDYSELGQNDSETGQSAEVVNNETISVNTVAKPVDFDNPATPGNQTKQPERTAAEKVNEQAPQSQQSQIESQKPQPTSKSSPFTSNGWVIQLGVFGRKSNVTALEKKLNDAGFATFSRDIKARSGKVLTKVYVGPELDKEVLNKSLAQVNKLAGIKGKISAYQVRN